MRRSSSSARSRSLSAKLCALCHLLLALPLAAADFNVKDFGAAGDGARIDSPAINAAIEAAAKHGGGTVVLPPGTYLSFSIRLRSHITLRLEAGATLLAASPSREAGSYDPPEPNEWGDRFRFQDFGHSHWHNSLIWGEDLESVAITGGGLINGKGLVRSAEYPTAQPGPNGTDGSAAQAEIPPATIGSGDKAIALKNSRKVEIRDISILMGGHFAILVTGVDDLTLRNLTIDTNRDGIDIDASSNVDIRDCRVNSPNDDAIVLKSSFALGMARATEHVRIEHCLVSGYDVGTLLSGARGGAMQSAPDRDGPTGRIKIGTESNGAFRHILIRDCVFERSRGLALETVDGGIIEDVLVQDLRMREIFNPAIFLRIGNRARGPAGTPVGTIRDVTIRNVAAQGVDSRYSAILLAALPGHAMDHIRLENIRISARGALTPQIVAEQPPTLANEFFLRGKEAGVIGPRDPFAVPEREKAYPEPSMFGLLPAGAMYLRHVQDLTMSNVSVGFQQPDTRPRVVLEDASHVRFERVDVAPAAAPAGASASAPAAAPAFVLLHVQDYSIEGSARVKDVRHGSAENLRF